MKAQSGVSGVLAVMAVGSEEGREMAVRSMRGQGSGATLWGVTIFAATVLHRLAERSDTDSVECCKCWHP